MPESDRLTTCTYRATVAERSEIEAAAVRDGLTTSEWTRAVLVAHARRRAASKPR